MRQHIEICSSLMPCWHEAETSDAVSLTFSGLCVAGYMTIPPCRGMHCGHWDSLPFHEHLPFHSHTFKSTLSQGLHLIFKYPGTWITSCFLDHVTFCARSCYALVHAPPIEGPLDESVAKKGAYSNNDLFPRA